MNFVLSVMGTAERTNDGEYYFEYEESSEDNMVFSVPVEKDMDDLYIFYDGTQVENAEISVNGTVVRQGDIDGYMLPIGQVEDSDGICPSFSGRF